MNSNSSLLQIMHQMANLVPKYCDKCGAKHSQSDLTILDEGSEKVVCKLQCTNCNNTYMIHVQNSHEGVVAKRANIKSEITQNEYQKFAKSASIESEEILDVYMALEAVDSIADFDALVKE